MRPLEILPPGNVLPLFADSVFCLATVRLPRLLFDLDADVDDDKLAATCGGAIVNVDDDVNCCVPVESGRVVAGVVADAAAAAVVAFGKVLDSVSCC